LLDDGALIRGPAADRAAELPHHVHVFLHFEQCRLDPFDQLRLHVQRRLPASPSSRVLSCLMRSRRAAAFSNSRFAAAAFICACSAPTCASRSACVLKMPPSSAVVPTVT